MTCGPETGIVASSTAAFAAASALGAAAGWGLGTSLFERALRAGDVGAAAANFFKNVLATATFTVAALLLGARWPDAGATRTLLVSGFLGFAVGDTAVFAALPRCGVQLTTLCGNLIPPLAALLGFAFLGERLAWATIASMGVCILGIALVVLDRAAPLPARELRRTGILFAVLAATSQALAIVAGRRGFEGVELLPGTLARLAGGLLGAVALALLANWRTPRGGQRPLTLLVRPLVRPPLGRRLVPAAFFAAILVLPLHSAGLRGLPSGVSAALFATTPLFTLPIGYYFFGARFGPRSVVGTVLGFAGTLGTIWSTR